MHEFRLGETLGRGFRVFFKNFVPITLLLLIVYSPLAIYAGTMLSRPDLTLGDLEAWDRVMSLVGIPLGLIATATVVYGTFEELRGRRPGIGKSIEVGLKRLFPVLGVGILVVLLVALGLVLLVVPGFIIMCMLYVAVPVSVVEGPGVSNSLSRSRELTAGYRWQIFGLLMILGLIGGGIQFGLSMSLVNEGMSLSNLKTYIALALLVDVVTTALGSVVNAVAYHDLRVVKEGIGTEELASIFD